MSKEKKKPMSLDRNVIVKQLQELKTTVERNRQALGFIIQKPLTKFDFFLQRLDIKILAIQELLIEKNVFSEDELVAKVKALEPKQREEMEKIIAEKLEGNSPEKVEGSENE